MVETLGDLEDIALTTAVGARQYLTTVMEVASGAQPESSLSLLLLAVSDAVAVGARLGAMTDIVPAERFEPDLGPDEDIDPLRTGLANIFDGIDEYYEVDDPLVSPQLHTGSVANDLTDVASALIQGLRHYEAGKADEALWWWQFSYLSAWGERAASALRVLHSLLAHIRLDAEEDTVAEAEFDALHSTS